MVIPSDKLSEFLLYTSPDEVVKVEIHVQNETVWLTQKKLAELFQLGVPAISKHLKNIFDSGELLEDSVISILETTAAYASDWQEDGDIRHRIIYY